MWQITVVEEQEEPLLIHTQTHLIQSSPRPETSTNTRVTPLSRGVELRRGQSEWQRRYGIACMYVCIALSISDRDDLR
jgi:hypothetical protein